MLHKSIGDQNEIARKPTSQGNSHRSQEVMPGSQSLLAPDERAYKCALQKESEHTFHGQRLSDYAPGVPRKSCPVRSELKFHGNARDNTHGKIEAKNLRPKANRVVVLFIARFQGAPFPVDQEPGQSHGELRKKVMIGQREAELESAPKPGSERFEFIAAPSCDQHSRSG